MTYGTTNSAQGQQFDQMLHWKLAGTILLALATVFILQRLGFKFVVAGSIG